MKYTIYFSDSVDNTELPPFGSPEFESRWVNGEIDCEVIDADSGREAHQKFIASCTDSDWSGVPIRVVAEADPWLVQALKS